MAQSLGSTTRYHRPGLPLRSGLPSSHPCPTSKVWAAEKSGSRYREVMPMERGGEPGEMRPPPLMPGLQSASISLSHRMLTLAWACLRSICNKVSWRASNLPLVPQLIRIRPSPSDRRTQPFPLSSLSLRTAPSTRTRCGSAVLWPRQKSGCGRLPLHLASALRVGGESLIPQVKERRVLEHDNKG